MMMSRIDWIGALAALCGLIAAPLLLGSTYIIGILTVALCFGMWAASWDFMSGLTGRENFGHSLFIGAGAYTAGFLNVNFGIVPWWSLVAAPIVAVMFSLVIGFPTLRLKGPYFALAMLSAATMMQSITVIFSTYTGGQDGLNGLDPILYSQLDYYYLVLGFLVASVCLLKVIANSSWGTLLRAIRGDEASCQAAGINVTFYKIASLMISAAVAGLGGALYAHYQLQVGPDLFTVILSINIIIMVYVGGMGSIYGPVGGAILLSVLTEALRGLSEYRLWVYTLVLIFILFFMPNGLIAPLWRRLRSITS
ncbi:MAG TPA: branched-chain amino acid ABC transporter permease [Xanthobacteraceae bacterium]|jgi:branched-chain amino acid transport system permease protein|nr:branched-chain amino acid ABC transporter permease [Xanthobacteraceae bacterium]